MAHLFMPISPKILMLYISENDYYVKNRMMAAVARISGTQVAMSFVMGWVKKSEKNWKKFKKNQFN